MKKSIFYFLFSIHSFLAFCQTAEEYGKLAEDKVKQKDYQYAMVLIDKAIALDNKNEWYVFQKAEIQFKLTGHRDAIKIVKSAILLNPKEAEGYSRAGNYYTSAGIDDSAIVMYNIAIKLAKNDTIKYAYIINRGTAKGRVRDFSGAAKDYEACLAFNPNDIAALNNLSPCYRELGMPGKSISCLKKIIKLDSTFLGAYMNLGFLYSKLDSLDLAITYFNTAIKMNPEEPVTYNNRGYVYYKMGEYAKALKDINLSIKMYPQNSYAYKNLALVYIATDKLHEACTALSFASDYGFEKQYGPEVTELAKKYCK